jgi:hypothetical protein
MKMLGGGKIKTPIEDAFRNKKDQIKIKYSILVF